MEKILVIGPTPNCSKGGMATVIDDICKDKKLNSQYEIDKFGSYMDGRIVKRILYSIWAYLKFLCTKRNYDIYHIHAASRGSTFRKGYYVRAAKRWGKKVIFHIHGGEYMVFFNKLSLKKRLKVLDILNEADMVIALSQKWKDKFERAFGITNCVVLENGINVDYLSATTIDPGKHHQAFLSLGRLGKNKGSYDLVKAIKIVKKKIPDIKLYLAGDGEIVKVKEVVKAENLQENIEVVGWVDFARKLDLLKQVSTLVLPSYNEGLPMSILEGMACGKAVISTTVGAIPEVIGEENGILIDPGDVGALAEAIIKCANNLDVLQQFSRNNISKIKEEYSMSSMHKKLADYYQLVMEGNSNGSVNQLNNTIRDKK